MTHAELEHAIDLPNLVPWDVVKRSKMLPLKMFRVVLDLVVERLGPAVQERGGSR